MEYDDISEMSIMDMVNAHNELVQKYNELDNKYESLKDNLRDILEVTNEGY
jgi:uncharacterized protein YutE (UPF0331/DUF86 family)